MLSVLSPTQGRAVIPAKAGIQARSAGSALIPTPLPQAGEGPRYGARSSFDTSTPNSRNAATNSLAIRAAPFGEKCVLSCTPCG
jgi:hypothetical protein